MFTPRLTRRLAWVLLPPLSGELQLPLVQPCKARLLRDRSQIGTAASMSSSHKASLRPLTPLTSVMVPALLVGPRKQVLTKSLAGHSLMLLVVELLCARLRWVPRVATLLLTLYPSWQTLPLPVTRVLLVAALAAEALCLLHLLVVPLLLVVPTVARLVLAVLRPTTVPSPLPPRSVPSVTSVPHPQSPRTPTSSSTPVLAPLHRLAMRRALLQVLLRPLRLLLLLRPPPVSVATSVLHLR